MTTVVEVAGMKPNEGADFWYHEIGLNSIPIIAKNKGNPDKPISPIKYTRYEFEGKLYNLREEMPEELFEHLKKNNLYNQGIGVPMGLIHRGKNKGKYIVGVDCDNQKGVDTIFSTGLERAKNNTLIEQHKDRLDKCHAYFLTNRPVAQITPQKDAQIKVEVKGDSGQGLMFVAPSIHASGNPYEIVSNVLQPAFIDADNFEKKLNKLGLYQTTQNTTVNDLIKDSYEVYEGHDRGLAILRYLDSKKIKNPEFGEETLFSLGMEYNEKHCKPPKEEKIVKSLVKQSIEFGFKKLIEKEKQLQEEQQQQIQYIDDSVDLLEEIKKTVRKTVREDESLTNHIIFNGVSAVTNSQSHLMISDETSEGKTYPSLQIAQYFPKDMVITLTSATPQSLKYEHGVTVDADYNIIQDQVDDLYDRIDDAKGDKTKKTMLRELKKELRELEKDSKTLVDLRGKWIIFKEPPNEKLLEMLYSTLSNDEEYSEHKIVPDSGRGRRRTYTVVLQGTPALLIATARDDTQSKRWSETASRFTIISPKASAAKYRAGMELIGLKMGLPKSVYQEHVLDDAEKERCKALVVKLIESIKKTNGDIFNPFIIKLAEIFPQEKGYRWRQKQRFLNLLNMHTFCYHEQRPKAIVDGVEIPFVTLEDLKFAVDMSKNNEMIPPNKLDWFKDVFLEAWKAKGKKYDNFDATKMQVVTTSDISEWLKEEKKAKSTTKQIRETYIDSLYEFGLIEKAQDPTNKTRDCFWPLSQDLESSFIAISSFDESCVNLFKEQYLERRFEYVYKHKKITQEQLIKLIMTFNDDK